MSKPQTKYSKNRPSTDPITLMVASQRYGLTEEEIREILSCDCCKRFEVCNYFSEAMCSCLKSTDTSESAIKKLREK